MNTTLRVHDGLGYRVDGVYTFGQPRVGDRHFAESYNLLLRAGTFRFTNGSDLVPWIPFLLGRYRHAGNEVFMPSWGGWHLNPPTVYKLAADGLETWRAMRAIDKGIVPQTDDHHMPSYQQRVNALS